MNLYLQVLLISSKNLSSVQGSRSGRAYSFIVFMLSSSFSMLKAQLEFAIFEADPQKYLHLPVRVNVICPAHEVREVVDVFETPLSEHGPLSVGPGNV